MERYPESAVSHFHWGRMHLESDFPKAEPALYKSVELDIDFVPDVARFLQYGYDKADRRNDYENFKPFIEKFQALQSQADEERSAISTEDNLVPAEMDEATMTAMRTHLAEKYPEIKQVFLVIKQ